jgi:hypothetical protein
MNFNLSSENLLLPRTRSEDDISDYEEAIDQIILNLEDEDKGLDNELATRIGCQSPLPSTKFMKYINRDKDNYSVVSDLTEFEDKDEDTDTDEEYEINYKIWPIEYDYIQDYEEGYEECYRDDLSEANGNHSYCS